MKNNRCLAQYIRSFFEDHLVQRKNLSHNSIWSYRDAVKLLIQFVTHRTGKSAPALTVTDINEQAVLDFLEHLERKRGNAVQTCNQRLMTLRTLFEYIAFREPLLIEHCKRITTIPLKRGVLLPQIGYLTKGEMQAMLRAVDRTTWEGRRNHMLLLYMYNTGSRVQEVADARQPWLSLHGPFKVQITGKGNKSRICPLWDTTAKALECYLEERNRLKYQSDHLFLNRCNVPLTRSGIAYIINACTQKAAALTPSLRNKQVTPHTFRHTTAMHLLQSGVEINVIKNWLGHVSVATTNRYVQIDLEMKAKALESCKIGQNKSRQRQKITPELMTWLESL